MEAAGPSKTLVPIHQVTGITSQKTIIFTDECGNLKSYPDGERPLGRPNNE
jgi:hypothetical protein